MKIRNGFVSNSSSSSFIVALPKKPKDKKQLAKFIFGDQKEYPNPYNWNGDTPSFPVDSVAQFLMSAFSYSRKKIIEKLVSEIGDDISWQVREIAKSYVRGKSSCYVIDNGNMTSYDVVADRSIKRHIKELSGHFPLINWEEKFKVALEKAKRFHQKEDELEKAMEFAEEKALKEAGLERYFKWIDVSKLPKKEAMAQQRRERKHSKKVQSVLDGDKEYQDAFKKRWNMYHEERDSEEIGLIAKSLVDIFLAENKGRVLAQVEIEDHSPMGSAMEHGTLFDKINHKKFSHH